MPRSFTLLPGLLFLFSIGLSSLTLASLTFADESKVSKSAASKSAASTDESDDEGPLLSVVLLQKKLPALSEKSVAASIQKAWKQKISIGDEDNKDATNFVVRGGPGFVIQCQDTFCMVILATKPYLEADALKEVEELRTRKMLQEHRAWLSLDLMGDIREKPAAAQDAEMARVIRLAAEMVDKNTMGILLPSEKVVLPLTDDVLAAMKGPDALKALRTSSNAAVVGSTGDDPEMQAATAEARRTWPEFVQAFRRKPENTENYAAKFPFDAPDQKEFMWVEVVSIKGDTVVGRLGNDPVWVKDLKLGDEVTMKVSELSDWMYLKEGEIVGGFTVKVLMEQQKREDE